MAASMNVVNYLAPVFGRKTDETCENKCEYCVEMAEELRKVQEEVLSLKEIINILKEHGKMQEGQIEPTPKDRDDNEWITVKKHRRNKGKVVQKPEGLCIPVIINKFIFPTVNESVDNNDDDANIKAQDSVKVQRKKGKNCVKKAKEGKILVLGDSQARGLSTNLKSMCENFEVCGFVKPGGRAKNVVDSNIKHMEKTDTVIVLAGTNDIGRDCTDEGVKHIVNFVKNTDQTNFLIVTAPHRPI